MNVFNSWVKWKGVVYIFYRQGLNGKLHVHSTWISYILKATACAFHNKVHVHTNGNLIFFLNYRRYFDYFNALHFSNNWVFYIKIHKSYSHSKFFSINNTNIRVSKKAPWFSTIRFSKQLQYMKDLV